MDATKKELWRRPWAVVFYGAAAFASLFALAARDCRQAAERQRAAQVPPPVPPSKGGTPLEFGRASLSPGTAVMRIDLIRRGSGYEYSSGSYGEVRNILFLDPGAKAGRWLLPDADHVIAECLDIAKEEPPEVQRPLAVVALVKPHGGDLRLTEGKAPRLRPNRRARRVAFGRRANPSYRQRRARV
jgi:hypothetical protein